MILTITFVLGVMMGAAIGLLLMAVLICAKCADCRAEIFRKYGIGVTK